MSMQFSTVGLGAAFHFLPEHDPAQQARTALLLPLRVSGNIVLPRCGGEHRMDDDLHRVLVVSAGVLLLLCYAPPRRSADLTFVFLGQHLLLGCGGRHGGLGVGELLGEDARERLRLVVGPRVARPGVADGGGV